MYNYELIKKFVTQVFVKIGCNHEDAEKGAEILIAAELRGIPSHGVLRLKDYLNLWEKKTNQQQTKCKNSVRDA